jgi:hypothetical protein
MSLQEVSERPIARNIKVFRNECLINYQMITDIDFSDFLELVKFEDKSFENAFQLRNIVFPPNIEVIKGFNNCTSLISLDFPILNDYKKSGIHHFQIHGHLRKLFFHRIFK